MVGDEYAEDDISSAGSYGDEWAALVEADAGEQQDPQLGSPSEGASGQPLPREAAGAAAGAPITRAASSARSITVHRYPRLVHPLRPDDHYVRLVDNSALGVQDMRAVCGVHVNCTLNRLSRKRPLGLLWAWLGAAADAGTKLEHKAMLPIPHARRAAARAELDGNPDAADWRAAEGPSDGAEQEPLSCP